MGLNCLRELPLGLCECHRLKELQLHDNWLRVAAFPEAISALTRLTSAWTQCCKSIACLHDAYQLWLSTCTRTCRPAFRCLAVLELDRNWLTAVPCCLLDLPLRKLSLLSNPVRHLPGETRLITSCAVVATCVSSC